ncbi:aldehyde dehydrogenase family protein [Candidatus Marimicrobium litorale]|jgi:acyl-CoA reductase-like NAD-dependent aldehyde dehydrogenase|uniref:Aldehyde dehydrogenase n=1 Tax=Candidatus Marimicrobium litorale TaxID=2518991 RepID=A0ABT3T580_9GAMM|nr:aldehyde dehydrogenase family protein [Candidatus Marimicrobium litorale]MCX2977443.1 aldehyde dehydrogenase family protein [Candidatus Marimicrobium litorale]
MSIYEPLESNDSRRHLKLRSPVTLEETGELVCANAEDVKQAIARARVAQPAWASTSMKERRTIVERALKIVLERQDEIIETVVKETGKCRTDAMSMEVFSVADQLCYYAKNAEKFLKPRKRKVHGLLKLMKQLRIMYKPLGVVGLITPWNGPFVLVMNQATQAVLAGNTVVAKGSEVTPYSAKLAEDIYRQAGLPEGVLQVLLGDGETGAAIVNGGVDKVSFTGSVATGRKVAEACASQLIPVTLELGGNDAMIVCADADIDRAADGAWVGSCMNTGHYCCGTERIYVVKDVYDEFLRLILDKGKALRQGQKHGWDEDVGAVFWDRQMTIIEAHVEDARAKGATIHMGGRRNPELPGLYYEPTVITDVDNSMDIMILETFGPILCIQKVDSEAEALRLANDSEFGLNGNVWTKDKDKGYRMASAIDTGSCSVNDMAVSYGIPAAPFGGKKNSGLGQVNGKKGLRGYCHEMPIVIDRFGGKMQNGYPYDAKSAEGMKKLMEFLWVKTPIGRWMS